MRSGNSKSAGSCVRLSSPSAMMAIPALARTRGPKRSEAAPLKGATRAIVIGTGVSSRPASMGEKPRSCWSRNGSRNVAVNKPEKATTTLTKPAENGRILKRAKSIMGWIDRRSVRMKAAPRTTKATTRPTTAGLVQPHCWPSLRARRSAKSAAPESMAPRTSNDWPLPGVSLGSTRAAHTMANRPIGALMRKIARQVATWVKIPPSAGPRLSPMETLMPFRPSARPRSLAGNVRATIAGPMAMIIAAPTPWMTRNAVRVWTLGDAPHRMLATVKSAKPTR